MSIIAYDHDHNYYRTQAFEGGRKARDVFSACLKVEVR